MQIMKDHSSCLSRRDWRRLEREALEGHRSDLLLELNRLAQQRAVVLGAAGSLASGVISLELAGHRPEGALDDTLGTLSGWRLSIGGIAPSVARAIIERARSGGRVEVRATGRYKRFWWIDLGGDREQMILASHVRLSHDPGRPHHSASDHPVLSGAT